MLVLIIINICPNIQVTLRAIHHTACAPNHGILQHQSMFGTEPGLGKCQPSITIIISAISSKFSVQQRCSQHKLLWISFHIRTSNCDSIAGGRCWWIAGCCKSGVHRLSTTYAVQCNVGTCSRWETAVVSSRKSHVHENRNIEQCSMSVASTGSWIHLNLKCVLIAGRLCFHSIIHTQHHSK